MWNSHIFGIRQWKLRFPWELGTKFPLLELLILPTQIS